MNEVHCAQTSTRRSEITSKNPWSAGWPVYSQEGCPYEYHRSVHGADPHRAIRQYRFGVPCGPIKELFWNQRFYSPREAIRRFQSTSILIHCCTATLLHFSLPGRHRQSSGYLQREHGLGIFSCEFTTVRKDNRIRALCSRML